MKNKNYKNEIYLFLSFLQKEKVWLQFQRNFYRQDCGVEFRIKYKVPITFKDYMSYNFSQTLIDDAFRWGDTIEGFDFWNEIDTKWRHICITFREKLFKEKQQNSNYA